MKKKGFKVFILSMVFALAFTAVAQAAVTKLQSPNWEPNAKQVINDMFEQYGQESKNYDSSCKPYAVFDFDNTCSILDVEEQLAIYQLEHLRFGARPDQMYEILTTGIPDINKDLGEDYNHQTVAKVAQDAANAYAKLYAKGYVAADKSKESKMAEWMETADWKEFATKARWLYDAIGDNFDVSVSYPWITYWFTNMTPAQVEKLALESHTAYNSTDKSFWKKLKWESPKKYKGSKAGQLSIGYKQGITVSPEIQELWKCLKANGFDVYVCSASYLDVILAAVKYDVFGLNGNCDGVLAMTNVIEDGIITNKYDYDFHAQTQGIGKSQSISKLIAPKYNGRGPIFVAFDSQGDFNFCSEYKDTRVGLCLNRTRKDDAGILAAVAVYQNEKGITLAKAAAMGDTRYVLQGRNENGGYLWSRPEVQLLGKDKPSGLHEKMENGPLAELRAGKSVKEVIDGNSKLKGNTEQFVGYKVR